MQTKFHYVVPLLLLPAIASSNSQNPLSDVKVKVFTSSAYPVYQAHLAEAIYHLDGVEKLEESFLTNLSTNPKHAEQQVRQVMHTAEWKAFETKLKTAYQGVIEGWRQGVMKIPAVVFEMPDPTLSSVIYGESDVGKAIERYQAMQRGNP